MTNRFEWLKGVLQADLPDRAKVLASALAVQFYNEETGQLNPALATLANYLRCSEDSVRRAVADLINAGWLNKIVGNGRGNRSRYVLLSPGSVVAFLASKGSQNCRPFGPEKGRRNAAKGSQNCNSHIRQEQSLEQRARARPSPHLAAIVSAGSWHADEWARWLAEHDQPTLALLTGLHVDGGGFCLPWSVPPKGGDETSARVALSIIEWAKAARQIDAA